MNRKTLLPVVFLLAAGPTAANATEGLRPHPGIAEVRWQKMSGWVQTLDRERRSLQLRDRSGNLAVVMVDDRVQIFRNWRLVAIDDIRLNDHVILRRKEAGL